jgi:hypothetical protein
MRAMGYARVSVAHMAKLTLHHSFQKKRDVQLSNWETAALRWEQAKYAALDVFTVNHSGLGELAELPFVVGRGGPGQQPATR